MYGWLANGATAEPAKPERDLLTFPDAKEAPAVDTGKPGERRAA